MINAQEYEELLYKAIEYLHNNNVLDAMEFLQPLLDTQDIYKKSNIEGVFVRVGRLTSRNEIILDTPPNDKLDISEPIVTYERGWWIYEDNLIMNSGNGQYKYLETKPYNVLKDTGEQIEELCSTENEYSVLGYTTRLKTDNKMRNIVLYNQYLTGEEHGKDERSEAVATKYGRDIIIDGTKTKIAK